MSFRDNLQHLRATRNMTQEQLAMLLGVSRQSVTKWEAEKSYPEMDKLLKICQIFECSLDDLVQGDLAARPAELRAAVAVPAGPPTDICGYDEHQRMMARKVPAGVAVLLAVIGVAFLCEGMRPLGIEDGGLFMLVTLVGILAGCAFLIPAGMEHTAFVKAHPYVEDFYTEDQKAGAHAAMARACIAGLGLIFAGVALMIFIEPVSEKHALFALMECIAAGTWLLVRYGMLLGRVNVAEYNKSVAEDLEMEEIAALQVEDAMRDALLTRKRAQKKVGRACGVIMMAATIVALVMLFAPVLTSPDPDAWQPEGTSAMYFWMAWVVGGILCGIASVLLSRDE